LRREKRSSAHLTSLTNEALVYNARLSDRTQLAITISFVVGFVVGMIVLFAAIRGFEVLGDALVRFGLRTVIEMSGLVIIGLVVLFIVKDKENLQVTVRLEKSAGAAVTSTLCAAILLVFYPLLGVTGVLDFVSGSWVNALILILTLILVGLAIVFVIDARRGGRGSLEMRLPRIVILVVVGVLVLFAAKFL